MHSHTEQRSRERHHDDDAAGEDRDVGDVERVRAVPDEIGHQAESRPVDEVAEPSADEQAEADQERYAPMTSTSEELIEPEHDDHRDDGERERSRLESSTGDAEVLHVLDRIRAEQVRSLTGLEGRANGLLQGLVDCDDGEHDEGKR